MHFQIFGSKKQWILQLLEQFNFRFYLFSVRNPKQVGEEFNSISKSDNIIITKYQIIALTDCTKKTIHSRNLNTGWKWREARLGRGWPFRVQVVVQISFVIFDECLLNLNLKLKLEVNIEPIHVQVISDFMQNVKRWTSEIFSREDLERVNEEFHENGTVSYETKKVSFLRRDDIPRWF